MNEPNVSVIVLHWDGLEYTKACIQSILKSCYTHYKIWVINNNPQVQLNITLSDFPAEIVRVINTNRNLGYAGGNNFGIELSITDGAEYIWIVNNDVIVDPNALSQLVEAAKYKPRISFCGPLVLIREDPHRILSAGGYLRDGYKSEFRGVGHLNLGQFSKLEQVDYLSGCALLVSIKMIKSIGMLNEKYFLYHEDVEWCYRAKKAGFEVLFVPDAYVWHPDTRLRDDASPNVVYYMTRNQLMFLKDYNFSRFLIFKTCLTYLRTWLSWKLRPKWHGKVTQAEALLMGLIDFLKGQSGPK